MDDPTPNSTPRGERFDQRVASEPVGKSRFDDPIDIDVDVIGERRRMDPKSGHAIDS